jgi:hypothetical protein
MRCKVFGKENFFPWLWVFFGLLVIWGCHPQKPSATVKKPTMMGINKVVIVGFDAAVPQGKEADVVRSPLSGSVFMAEPVPQDVVQRMTDILFNKTEAEKGYEIISPAQAKGVISRIMRSDQTLVMSPVKILQDVGKAFDADAVLAGYLYRWREREGTDYAVNRPASVAFDLHLISTVDGTILWNAKFDKTQRSLSENVFDLATFFKSKGRWLTAEKLAILGFKKMLAAMPAKEIPEIRTRQIEPEGY